MSPSTTTANVPPPATVGGQRVTTPETRPAGVGEVVFRTSNLDVFYGNARALKDVNIDIRRNEITALIGPSGCGKSTFLRCLNRMNDLIPGARVDGDITFHGQDLYGPDVDAVDVRRRVGMVFQTPNPFPRSIKDNLLFGMKVNGLTANDERVEAVLRQAALWDEVKDTLNQERSPSRAANSSASASRVRSRWSRR